LFATFAGQGRRTEESPHRQVILRVTIRVREPTNERRERHDLPCARALQPQRHGRLDRKRGDPRRRRVANSVLLPGDVPDKCARTANPAGRVRGAHGVVLDTVR